MQDENKDYFFKHNQYRPKLGSRLGKRSNSLVSKNSPTASYRDVNQLDYHPIHTN